MNNQTEHCPELETSSELHDLLRLKEIAIDAVEWARLAIRQIETDGNIDPEQIADSKKLLKNAISNWRVLDDEFRDAIDKVAEHIPRYDFDHKGKRSLNHTFQTLLNAYNKSLYVADALAAERAIRQIRIKDEPPSPRVW
ncbi:hypothetical protein [Cohaesibacter intestini]|uniref:hypothetical protein n=1 Tax=Cohaesibacter intestini TaxID=2211145 RepID=UPI000DE8095C|nr:hypothetical protein [Cohaesibacter intestini]